MPEQRPAVCPRPLPKTRCPFCHDELHRGGVECGGCGARHHSMCADENHVCASCGYDLGDQTHRVLLREAEARDGWWRRFEVDRRAYHLAYERWRRHLWRPLIIGGVAAGCALGVLVHMLTR